MKATSRNRAVTAVPDAIPPWRAPDLEPPPAGVLVLEAVPGGSNALADTLQKAGFPVLSCRAPDDSPARCAALASGSACPFDMGPVALVVDVRGEPASVSTETEIGLVCAASRDVPIVVTAARRPQPGEVSWAAATCRLADAAAFVEALLRRPGIVRELHVEQAVRHGLDDGADPARLRAVRVRDTQAGPVVTVVTDRLVTTAGCTSITQHVTAVLGRAGHPLRPALHFTTTAGATEND